MEIEELHVAGAEFVVSFSGGKDSSAMLEHICDRLPNATIHCVLANTGWEHEGIEEWCRSLVARRGFPLYVARNPNKDFFSMVRHRQKFPAPAYRQCTSDLKRGPIEKWIRNHCGKLVVNCMGLRAEESDSRAKRPQLSLNKSMTNSKREVWDWLPIKDWTTAEVFSYLILNNIPLHPAYSYLDRLSCQVCIYASNKDLAAIRTHNPIGFQRIADLEQEIGFTMKQGGTVNEWADRA